MPAKDHYHSIVIRALVKDGWTITHDQFTIILPERFLWIDLRAENALERRAILVEVKAIEGASAIEALAAAVGKYSLYIAALEVNKINEPLYLAVPLVTFQGILSETIGQRLIQREGIRLVVFDPQQEAIVQWIP